MNSNLQPQPLQPSNTQPWTAGLCDCFNDPRNCIITCCCPCVTFGQNSEIIDRGNTSCAMNGLIYYLLASVGCCCLYGCTFRARLRGQFLLEEAPCGDCCIHCCCAPCALCQEFRELKNRGYDPSIGWQANQARISQGANVAPPLPTGMNR